MAAFIKSLSRFLGGSSKPEPSIQLAAFGKHPGWNDHLDDLGLDTDSLITAKRLLYVQGINQNIDAEGSFDVTLDAAVPSLAASNVSAMVSSGRCPIPMVTPPSSSPAASGPVPTARAATNIQWSSAASSPSFRRILPRPWCSRSSQRFRPNASPPPPLKSSARSSRPNAKTSAPGSRTRSPASPSLPGASPPSPIAPTCSGKIIGFHRIVYQFASGLAAYRTPAAKSAGPRRPEQLRLPACDMAPPEALLFWLRFALTFVDLSTPLLLIAPDCGCCSFGRLIATASLPANIFCIKAGTGSLPLTSDIPYTLDPGLVRTIDSQYIASSPRRRRFHPTAPWPMFQ